VACACGATARLTPEGERLRRSGSKGLPGFYSNNLTQHAASRRSLALPPGRLGLRLVSQAKEFQKRKGGDHPLNRPLPVRFLTTRTVRLPGTIDRCLCFRGEPAKLRVCLCGPEANGAAHRFETDAGSQRPRLYAVTHPTIRRRYSRIRDGPQIPETSPAIPR
jgi:hypothetical protein